MRTKTNEIQCDVCGKSGAKLIHVTKSYVKGANLLVIEKVPVISCPTCGESYLTATTLREIDKLKRNRKKLATERFVRVSIFA